VQGYAGTTTGLVLRNVTVQDCGGHGLWLTEATSLDMAGSLITGNSGVDSANGNKGAGIFVLGTQANPSSMTISTSSITSNISPYRAGGIYAEQTTVSITDSAVDENTASNDGGGAYFQECPSVTLTRTTFNRNTGLDAGGCTLRDVLTSTITDCHFDENSGEDGGGLRLFSNIAAMTSSILGATTIDRNTASNDSGGLELDSFNSLTVTIGGTTSISNNTVPGQGDPRGGLNLQGDGGINCTLQDDVVISGNSAQGSAGGINVTSGGAANTLTIKDRVRVTGNTSVTGFGGGILMNCSQVTSTLTFVGGDMQITGNTAPNAAGIAAVGSCNVDGVTNAVVTGNNTVDCATSPDFNTWTTVACDQL
jgi:hypothetical protein